MLYVSSGAEITTTKNEFGRVNTSEFRALQRKMWSGDETTHPPINGVAVTELFARVWHKI